MKQQKGKLSNNGQANPENTLSSGASGVSVIKAHDTGKPGFFMRFISWIAKGSEQASKAGALCAP